jgi:hypothetical protein
VSTARNINQQNSRKDKPRCSPEEAEHDKRDHNVRKTTWLLRNCPERSNIFCGTLAENAENVLKICSQWGIKCSGRSGGEEHKYEKKTRRDLT